MTLCSPDPQAARPADEPANVLNVNLATNFKAAAFAEPRHNALLTGLAHDIDKARLEGADIPVKLRVHDSLFVPFAKWAMLLTGNYRCVTRGAPISIRDAVHGDLDHVARDLQHGRGDRERIGAQRGDLVPFDKYASAAERLINPSSAARAIAAGAPLAERVDKLVQMIGKQHGISHPAIDQHRRARRRQDRPEPPRRRLSGTATGKRQQDRESDLIRTARAARAVPIRPDR